VAVDDNGERLLSDRAVEFRVSAQLENLAIMRTLIGAVGTFEDLDFDAVSDLRLAIDEACTWLIKSASAGATLVVVVSPSEDEVVITASTVCGSADSMSPGSFSWHVLTSLTDEVATFDAEEPGGGFRCGISLTTRRVSSLR
jgi:anti-sigma regulatory factor (Ser/Thr protein kinase)